MGTFLLLAFTITFITIFILGKPFIYQVKKLYITQYVREEGPQSHQEKAGTPTMGGIIIILPAVIFSVLFLKMTGKLTLDAVMFLFVLFGSFLIGLTDDYLKVVKKNNDGIKPRQKLLYQIIIASIAAAYIFVFKRADTISLFGYIDIQVSIFYCFIAIFIIVGSSNAVNLTDGLDGLAASTLTASFLTLTFIYYQMHLDELSILSVILAAACLGFYLFNRHPAQIFMGDAGSLALGSGLGMLALLGRLDLWLACIGAIFVIETLSVIIQVISFKTRGKRIFKMSPLHHHFELSGWNETKVVQNFFIFQCIFLLMSIMMISKVYKFNLF